MRKTNVVKFLGGVLFWAVLSSTSFAWEPWKFIVTADSRGESASDHNGVNVTILSEIAAEVIKHDVEFLLFAGDLSTGASHQQTLEEQFMTWRGTMQPVYDAGIKVYNNRGNHDCTNYPSCIDAWNNVFSGPYALPDNGPAGEVNLTYSVTHKNVFVLALDELKTPNHSENYVHQVWVDDVLAANTKPHIFAFGHYTAFKMMWDSLGDHPAARDLFWESLENAGGRTYFCGHEHFFDRASADDDGDPNNDLYQYVIGSAGAPEHNWKGDWIGDNSDMVLKSIYHTVRFGYVIVDINGPDATLTWMERHTNEPNIPGIYQPMDILSYTVVCGDTDHPYPLGDIDKDCYVNYFDLAIIGNQWELPPGVRSADIAPEVPDGVVNRLDLAVFAAHWLEYLDP